MPQKAAFSTWSAQKPLSMPTMAVELRFLGNISSSFFVSPLFAFNFTYMKKYSLWHIKSFAFYYLLLLYIHS